MCLCTWAIELVYVGMLVVLGALVVGVVGTNVSPLLA